MYSTSGAVRRELIGLGGQEMKLVAAPAKIALGEGRRGRRVVVFGVFGLVTTPFAIPITIVTVYVVALFAVTAWARKLTQRGGGGIVG